VRGRGKRKKHAQLDLGCKMKGVWEWGGWGKEAGGREERWDQKSVKRIRQEDGKPKLAYGARLSQRNARHKNEFI